jgi:hypothetical protein
MHQSARLVFLLVIAFGLLINCDMQSLLMCFQLLRFILVLLNLGAKLEGPHQVGPIQLIFSGWFICFYSPCVNNLQYTWITIHVRLQL